MFWSLHHVTRPLKVWVSLSLSLSLTKCLQIEIYVFTFREIGSFHFLSFFQAIHAHLTSLSNTTRPLKVWVSVCVSLPWIEIYVFTSNSKFSLSLSLWWICINLWLSLYDSVEQYVNANLYSLYSLSLKNWLAVPHYVRLEPRILFLMLKNSHLTSLHELETIHQPRTTGPLEWCYESSHKNPKIYHLIFSIISTRSRAELRWRRSRGNWSRIVSNWRLRCAHKFYC